MARALLIEDEIRACADLRGKLAAHAEVAIVAEAATFRNAQALLARTDYDLVFLDIRLIGGDAFDLVPLVRPGARIIFVTAYDSYALRAFEVNALDYLLKPVVPARLAEALGRVAASETPPVAALRPGDVVCLRDGPRARFAPVADISAITAYNNYSEVQIADGEKVLVRKSLKEWENCLPAAHFMRVHRTQIVNLSRVVRYHRGDDERTLLYVIGAADPIAASRYRWSDLRSRLARLHPES